MRPHYSIGVSRVQTEYVGLNDKARQVSKMTLAVLVAGGLIPSMVEIRSLPPKERGGEVNFEKRSTGVYTRVNRAVRNRLKA